MLTRRKVLHVARPASTLAGILLSTVLFLAAATGESQSPESRSNADVGNDSILRIAREALAQGRPWRATEVLSPLVNIVNVQRTEIRLLAARAASRWKGWTEVERLLGYEVWLDSAFGGEGRELLARAQLSLRGDSTALASAELALIAAVDDSVRLVRTILLAQAAGAVQDAARAAFIYSRVVEDSPPIADWLRLRQAQFSGDSAERRMLQMNISLPHARATFPLIDARSALNSADTVGAITRFRSAGYPVRAATLALRIARSGDDSAAVRAELLRLLEGSPSPSDAQSIGGLLDSFRTPLTASQELQLARTLGAAGGDRAAQAYSRAFAASLGTTNDHFANASLLARLGRSADAIAAFASIKAPPGLAAAAAYQRARTMLRSDASTEWREALRAVVRDFPEDTSAATALFLLADIATDEGRDEAAREAFLSSARRFPQGSRAPASLFQAAMIAYVLGDYATAAAEMDELRQRYPSSGEATAALYWRGRARDEAGGSDGIAESCAAIRRGDSLSYYSALCASRLGTSYPLVVASSGDFVPIAAMDSAVVRIRALARLGFDEEISLELDYIRSLAGTNPEALLTAANLYAQLGYGSRGVSLAQSALNRGAARDGRLYRLLYPATHLDLVGLEASQYGVDLWTLAGLIRQESLFNPQATSPAGARGLMQVMPALGATMASDLSFPVWDPVLLWQPDVNARLGVRHFSDLLATQSHLYHVLASYNAGAQRVERWLTKRGMNDPEVFVERIPFVETRDYVRTLVRNHDVYRALYPDGIPGQPGR